ncbi:arsenate reductase family protein [Roseovarius aestuariivivens]|uniref:arsenate reductase family protein n=1 Tax=Roseovarius aestuariivivens TaxID=1888910 RepID=UPI00107FDE4A|nr:ArsC/Spx/MgsR family protein [Roseovarius aestuariivivens]
MTLYGLKTCDTCRKALKSLDKVEFRDIRSDGIPPDVLKSAYAALGDELVNRRSTTWRGLSHDARAADPLTLLAEHPTLMKRPLITDGTRFFLGWGKDVQADLMR